MGLLGREVPGPIGSEEDPPERSRVGVDSPDVGRGLVPLARKKTNGTDDTGNRTFFLSLLETRVPSRKRGHCLSGCSCP